MRGSQARFGLKPLAEGRVSLATEDDILSRVSRELPAREALRLWLVQLDDPEVHEVLDAVLSADEKERAAAYPSATRARRFASLRGVLRLLLGRLIGRAPADVQFVYGRDGKPALAPNTHALPPLYFNVSHARDLALVAVAESRQVGADLAFAGGETRIAHVAARFFSAPEQALLERLEAGAAREAFWRIWVRKEAYLKGRGEGISERIHETDFSDVIRGASQAGLPRVPKERAHRDQDRWEFLDVDGLPSGYVGSVARERLTT